MRQGRNNQVLAVTDGSGKKVVLKRYFHHAGDRRNRLDHEVKFLQFANKAARVCVPTLLSYCAESRVSLIEWVEGREFTSSPTKDDVAMAAQFVNQLNRHRHTFEADALPLAADACLCWDDHLSLLDSRLKRLSQVEEPMVRDFVFNHLLPVGGRLLEWGRQAAPGPVDVPVPDRFVSPSDFGYHNALRTPDGSVTFLDFEYAGWDSGGKLLADFFSQPRFPVDPEFHAEFAETVLATCSSATAEAVWREMPGLLAIHALKWCCILLNDFLPVDCERRAFSGSHRGICDQLERATTYFEQVCRPRLAAL